MEESLKLMGSNSVIELIMRWLINTQTPPTKKFIRSKKNFTYFLCTEICMNSGWTCVEFPFFSLLFPCINQHHWRRLPPFWSANNFQVILLFLFIFSFCFRLQCFSSSFVESSDLFEGIFVDLFYFPMQSTFLLFHLFSVLFLDFGLERVGCCRSRKGEIELIMEYRLWLI